MTFEDSATASLGVEAVMAKGALSTEALMCFIDSLMELTAGKVDANIEVGELYSDVF